MRYSSLAWLAMEMRGNALPYLKAHGWYLAAAGLGFFLVPLAVARWIDQRRQSS